MTIIGPGCGNALPLHGRRCERIPVCPRPTPQFALAAEQVSFRETTARFAAEVLAPNFKAREKEGRVPLAIRQRTGELGLIGAEFPVELAGLGLNHVTSAVVREAIAEGDFNVGYVPVRGPLRRAIVARHAAPEIASGILPGVAAGETPLGLALTEPQGGSDAASLKLKAARAGPD